jgi:hypothetical protein
VCVTTQIRSARGLIVRGETPDSLLIFSVLSVRSVVKLLRSSPWRAQSPQSRTAPTKVNSAAKALLIFQRLTAGLKLLNEVNQHRLFIG